MRYKLQALAVPAACAVLAAAMLAGCGGGNTADVSGGGGAGSAASGPNSPVATIDGVEIESLAVEMTGSTPNLEVAFANTRDADAEFDCTRFKVLKDGTEVRFATGSKTIPASQEYLQYSFTAEPDSLSAGDVVKVFYDDLELGEFEVGEF